MRNKPQPRVPKWPPSSLMRPLKPGDRRVADRRRLDLREEIIFHLSRARDLSKTHVSFKGFIERIDAVVDELQDTTAEVDRREKSRRAA